MGLATDASSAALGNALSSDEMRERSEEERSFASRRRPPIVRWSSVTCRRQSP